MKTKTIDIITVQDLDSLVIETYGKPYSFQQQDGCKDRGEEYIPVPCESEDYKNNTVSENVNDLDMGVSFKAWLERDPNLKLNSTNQWDRDHGLDLWWERNFYPHVSMIINDLHAKGLLDAGEYMIDIDW